MVSLKIYWKIHTKNLLFSNNTNILLMIFKNLIQERKFFNLRIVKSNLNHLSLNMRNSMKREILHLRRKWDRKVLKVYRIMEIVEWVTWDRDWDSLRRSTRSTKMRRQTRRGAGWSCSARRWKRWKSTKITCSRVNHSSSRQIWR